MSCGRQGRAYTDLRLCNKFFYIYISKWVTEKSGNYRRKTLKKLYETENMGAKLRGNNTSVKLSPAVTSKVKMAQHTPWLGLWRSGGRKSRDGPRMETKSGGWQPETPRRTRKGGRANWCSPGTEVIWEPQGWRPWYPDITRTPLGNCRESGVSQKEPSGYTASPRGVTQGGPHSKWQGLWAQLSTGRKQPDKLPERCISKCRLHGYPSRVMEKRPTESSQWPRRVWKWGARRGAGLGPG